ncbi:MAG: tRNA (adenosine(37)-N6)-threonylcarbamoyltransferase complex dimerization subunit type 1 TsaB, partial [Caulobacteraceae bacterium]
IDTCLEACQAALLDGETVLATAAEPMTRGHQERLAGMVGEVLASAGVAFAKIGRIAVTIGPGSFTGIRVGLAFAKGASLALSAPVVGVGTLEALAASVEAPRWRAAAIEAGRGRLWMQIFDGTSAVGAPASLSREEAIIRISGVMGGSPCMAVGSGAPFLCANLPGLASPGGSLPDPSVIARLGRQKESISHLQPLYLRPPDTAQAAR